MYKVHNLNRIPNYLNTERSPRHMTLKLSKVNDKERILKIAPPGGGGRMTIIYKGISIRLSTDFSVETLQAESRMTNLKYEKIKNSAGSLVGSYPSDLKDKYRLSQMNRS